MQMKFVVGKLLIRERFLTLVTQIEVYSNSRLKNVENFAGIFICEQRSADLNQMGQRERLSYSDEAKINRMYKCNKRPLSTTAEDQQDFRRPFANGVAQLFDAYTTPSFWQKIFNSWAHPQRYQQPLQPFPPPPPPPSPYFNDFNYYFAHPYAFQPQNSSI